jgi:hypothetical protein
MTGILLMAVGNSYGSAPVNTVAPAVTGTAQVRQTLSCSTGTWLGAPAPTFAYQWQSNSSNISGATSSTYQIVDAYVGTVMRCVVTATNSVAPGGVSANSNATSSVTANVPAAPTIGTATATGSTTASITFTAPSGALATGGSAITGYTMYSSGGQTATGGSSPITITGLTSETSYNFYVRANNAVGQSANSGTSNTITTSVSYWMSFLDNNWSGARGFPGGSDANGFTSIIGAGGYGNTPATRVNKEGAVGASAYTSSNNSVYPSENNNLNQGSLCLAGWSSTDGNTIYGGGYNYTGNQGAALSSVNASGSINWFRSWAFVSGGQVSIVQSINQGQDGYIYASGMCSGVGNGGFFIKIDTGGTQQWAFRDGLECTSATGDGSYSYLGAYQTSQFQGVLYSYNPSGTTRNWTRLVRSANGQSSGESVSIRYLVTYGGSVYAIGALYNTAQGIFVNGLIMKFSSSGSLTWARRFQDAGQNCTGNYLYVDTATGYLYATGMNNNANRQLFMKFDTNGNLVWLRRFYKSAGTNGDISKPGAISVTGSTMYFSLTYNVPNYAGLVVKLPNDGSKTGSYTGYNSCTYTYEASDTWGDASSYITVVTSTNPSGTNSTSPATTGNVAGAMSTARTLLANIP